MYEDVGEFLRLSDDDGRHDSRTSLAYNAAAAAAAVRLSSLSLALAPLR